MQLAAWLPVNTNCDGLQCAGSQISIVMQGLLRSVSGTSVVLQFPQLQVCRRFSFFPLNDFLTVSSSPRQSVISSTSHINITLPAAQQFLQFFTSSC